VGENYLDLISFFDILPLRISGELPSYLLRYRNVLKAGVRLLMSPLPFGAGFLFIDN
jgi:hypothetical protein